MIPNCTVEGNQDIGVAEVSKRSTERANAARIRIAHGRGPRLDKMSQLSSDVLSVLDPPEEGDQPGTDDEAENRATTRAMAVRKVI